MTNSEANYPRNFSREEMFFSATAARKNISNEPVDPGIEVNMLATALFLQQVRDKLREAKGREIPITVYSCYRSPKLNKAVGGSKNSAHMRALAADIVAKDMTPRELAHFIIDNFSFDQVICEFDAWVHVGIETSTARRSQILTALKRDGKTVYVPGIA